MTVGERIRMRRKELGLTADQVAERAGVNRATIYRYESDEIKNMGTETLVPLAAALRTTPAWLLMGEDDIEPDPEDIFQRIYNEDPRARKLFSMYSKATEEEKETAINVFKALLGRQEDD